MDARNDLAEPQARALAAVEARAEGPPLDPAVPVTVNFHPDAAFGPGTVLDALAERPQYRSQFETGLGNGSLTAHPGGARWEWESRLFAGAYDDAPPALRPVYGALDPQAAGLGGAPRFGSAHLRLRPHVLARCTFCYPDSTFAPADLGTARRMGLLALAAARPMEDPLDRYVEAQVHGLLDLARDVAALVLDPSFRDTPVAAAAQRLPVALEWHGGLRLAADRLTDCAGYRGAEVAAAAEALLRDGPLTPARLGAARPVLEPQIAKKVWHCLARFGRG